MKTKRPSFTQRAVMRQMAIGLRLRRAPWQSWTLLLLCHGHSPVNKRVASKLRRKGFIEFAGLTPFGHEDYRLTPAGLAALSGDKPNA